MEPDPASWRYPMRNDTDEEGARLRRLQGLHDRSSIDRLNRLGVAEKWDCVEIGAGAGSMAGWLSDQVGPDGSVTAVDRDLTQLRWLEDRPNVVLVEGDLTSSDFGEGRFDLAHSRSVLMHIDDDNADAVVGRVVKALRPGGMIVLEEADGLPLETRQAEDEALPVPFEKVMVPIALRWNWARRLPDYLGELGFVDIEDEVRSSPIVGATDGSEFWKHTLSSVRHFVTDQSIMAGQGRVAVDDETFDALIALLDDPDFRVPFTDRHSVSARRP